MQTVVLAVTTRHAPTVSRRRYKSCRSWDIPLDRKITLARVFRRNFRWHTCPEREQQTIFWIRSYAPSRVRSLRDVYFDEMVTNFCTASRVQKKWIFANFEWWNSDILSWISVILCGNENFVISFLSYDTNQSRFRWRSNIFIRFLIKFMFLFKKNTIIH